MDQEMTTMQRSFPVTGTARLSLRNVKGKIDIQPGTEGQIEVTAVKHPGRGFDRTEIEMTQAEDGSVTVATKYEDDLVGRWLGLGGHDPCRVDYTVRMPAADCTLEVATVSGPAHLTGLEGQFALRTVSGPLHLSALKGKVKLDSVSGTVTGEALQLSQALELTTVSGDVSLSRCRLPGVDASTVSGALQLDQGTAAAAYRFKSVSGDVHLRLPADSRCVVSLHTLSGRLRSNLPASHSTGHDEHAQPVEAAEAQVRVRFNSVSGDLNLVSDQSAPVPEGEMPEAPPVVDPAGPRTADERLALLEKVSRGEMSVDEALGTLNK